MDFDRVGRMAIKTNQQLHAIIFSLVFFLSLMFHFSLISANDWLTSEQFEIMGLNVQIYFTPEPGKISSELEEVRGIINVTRTNEDYILLVIVSSYGTVQGNESIDINDFGINIVINTTLDSYTEEIPLETPTKGSFNTFMVINFIWGDLYSPLHNKTVNMAAEYQKINRGIDLAVIIFPGGIIVIFFGILIGSNFILKKYKSQNLDLVNVDEKFEQIQKFLRKFLTRGGKFRKLDLTEIDSIPNPGDLGILEKRKKNCYIKLEKLSPRLQEFEEITQIIEEGRNPVVNNDLFKFISSNFIRASRKRENYPPLDNVGDKVQKLRDLLHKGKWSELQSVEEIKLAWFICMTYNKSTNESNKQPLGRDFNIENEAGILLDNIKSYNKVKLNTIWPPDANLVRQSRTNLLEEIQMIDRVFENFAKMPKEELKKFVKNCRSVKKEAKANLKWLDSSKDLVDESEVGRIAKRLQKIYDLLDKEIDLADHLRKKTKN